MAVRAFNPSNGQTVRTNHLFQSDACVALVHFHREFSPNSLNLENNANNKHPMSSGTHQNSQTGFGCEETKSKPRHKKTNVSSDPVKTHGKVLSYGLHLLTGVGVVLVGLPVGFNHLQRLFQNLRENMETLLRPSVMEQLKLHRTETLEQQLVSARLQV